VSEFALRTLRVDLNADMGELSGAEDEALMPHVTSASIACGLHAGDARVMRATVELARTHGVSVGAHPGFADREGFGRRNLQLPPREVEDLVLYQVGALAAIAASLGVRVRHVKPHGALYNDAAGDIGLALAIARAVRAIDGSIVLFGLAGSRLLEAGERCGLATASEVFADRAYRPDGSLQPRSERGSVLTEPERVAERAVAMVRDRAIIATDGVAIPVRVDTMCVHGDTPGAAELAARIRLRLTSAGVDVRAVGDARDR